MLRTGLLTGAALGLVMAASGAAQADVIEFCPGCADPGVNTNGKFFSGAAANLDAFTKASVFNWSSVNNNLPVGFPFTSNQQWAINIDNGGGTSASAGDTFFENFSFHLFSVGSPGVLDDPEFGATGSSQWDTDGDGTSDGTFPFPSHVYMTLESEGFLASDFSPAPAGTDDANELDLIYTKATFKMYFDPDGDTEDEGDRILIAQFGTLDNPAGESEGGVGNLNTLAWTVEWDAALQGVFRTESGKEIAQGGAFSEDPSLNEVEPGRFMKVTKQAITQTNVFDETEAGGQPGRLMVQVQSQSAATGTTVVEAVPEPGTLALLGAGLLGAGLIGRKRRKAA